MNIVEQLQEIPNLYHAQGCTRGQVLEAQKELGIIFPDEFVDYVREFGAISFAGTEWTGLNVDGYLNVVNATKQERNLNATFPRNCFVIENQGIEGLITVVDGAGSVYGVHYEKKDLICHSLSEYLRLCLARAK